jgi:hypothetical protein
MDRFNLPLLTEQQPKFGKLMKIWGRSSPNLVPWK